MILGPSGAMRALEKAYTIIFSCSLWSGCPYSIFIRGFSVSFLLSNLSTLLVTPLDTSPRFCRHCYSNLIDVLITPLPIIPLIVIALIPQLLSYLAANH